MVRAFLQVNSRFSATSMSKEVGGGDRHGLPQVYVAYQMDQFQLNTVRDKLLYLNKLKLDAKVRETEGWLDGIPLRYKLAMCKTFQCHENKLFLEWK